MAGNESVTDALLTKHNADEPSLTSTEVPSDSDESCGDRREISGKVTLVSPNAEKVDSNNDCHQAPPLAHLSYSTEEDEGRPELQQHHLGTLDDNGDEDSQASSSTLLSDLSSIEEKPELDRLEDDFELRDKLMKNFVVGKDTKHLKIVKEHEALMRKALRDHYEQQAVKEHTKRLKRKKRSKRSQSTLVNRVTIPFCFERRLAVVPPLCCIVLLICRVGKSSPPCYMSLHSTMRISLWCMPSFC